MKMGKRKYRMVLDDRKYVIEKKVDLILFKFWSRNYLWGEKQKYYETEELKLARKILSILNGIEYRQKVK
jgi:hypothetical protein